jgi:hypothetical protein
MLPRRDQYDEDVRDAAASATHYWMRFFAALRMTAEGHFGDWRVAHPSLSLRRVGV